MEGQMTAHERTFLNKAVYERLKNETNGIVLEVGTWKGGGSTLQISTALNSINNGHILHTCETDVALYTQAVESYSNHVLGKHIVFHNKPSTVVIGQLISENKIPKFVFFDGPEDSRTNLDDFIKLDAHLPSGTQFCMHDWDLDGLISTKARLLRPYLEKSENWRQISSLTKPLSVGIVLMEKL